MEASARAEKGEEKKKTREEMRPGQEIISGNLFKSSLDFDKRSSCSSVHIWPCPNFNFGMKEYFSTVVRTIPQSFMLGRVEIGITQ